MQGSGGGGGTTPRFPDISSYRRPGGVDRRQQQHAYRPQRGTVAAARATAMQCTGGSAAVKIRAAHSGDSSPRGSGSSSSTKGLDPIAELTRRGELQSRAIGDARDVMAQRARAALADERHRLLARRPGAVLQQRPAVPLTVSSSMPSHSAQSAWLPVTSTNDYDLAAGEFERLVLEKAAPAAAELERAAAEALAAAEAVAAAEALAAAEAVAAETVAAAAEAAAAVKVAVEEEAVALEVAIATKAEEDLRAVEEFRLVETARWDAAVAARIAESAQRRVEAAKLAVEEAAAEAVAVRERAKVAAVEAVAEAAATVEAAREAAVAADASAAAQQAELVGADAKARAAAEEAAQEAVAAAEREAMAAAQAQANRVAGLRLVKHPRAWDAAKRLMFSGVFTVDKAAPVSHGRPHWSNPEVRTEVWVQCGTPNSNSGVNSTNPPGLGCSLQVNPQAEG